MAGAAVVGALRVVLGADTAAFDKGLKDSQSSLTSFGNAMQIGLAAVATAAVAAGAALGVMIKHSIDNADNLNKMSQSTGLSVGALSKLNYAAELSDVSSEALGKSLGKLSKAMVSAATDGAGEAARAFQAMGVTVKNGDGTLRSSGDVLSDVAEKFSGYRDGADKTALSMQLFGKAGAGLIPLLNLGKEGLQDAGDEAEKFGLVLDKKTTMAAEAFNDNLKRMDKIKQGLVATMTAQLLPTFEHFSEVMLEAKQNSTLMSTAAEFLVSAFKAVVVEASQTVLFFQRLGVEAQALWTALKTPFELKGWEAVRAEGVKTDEMFAKLKLSLADAFRPPGEATLDWTGQLIGVKSMQKEVAALGAEWGKTLAPIVASGDASKNAVAKFLDNQTKRIAGLNAETATIGMAAGALEKLRIVKEAEALADANKIARTPGLIQSITDVGNAAANAALRLIAAQTAQQVMSPAEKYAQDLANLQTVYQSTDMTMATFQERQKQLAEGVGATWEQASVQGANGFQALAAQFAKSSKEMAMTAKALGIIEATINTYTAFTKALSSGVPPISYVAAAGVLAAGMAKVAAISSQSIGGFKDGLSMTVPGGVGGGDSRLFQAMVEPGEQIDITPNRGGNPRRNGNAGSVTTLHVTMADPVYSRDGMRTWFDRINELVSDGYRINVSPA